MNDHYMSLPMPGNCQQLEEILDVLETVGRECFM
jgi:hypothetical protein